MSLESLENFKLFDFNLDVFRGKMTKNQRVLKVHTIGRAVAESESGELCVFFNESKESFLLLIPEKVPWSEHDYAVSLAPGGSAPMQAKVGFANLLTGRNAGIIEIEIPGKMKNIFVNLENSLQSKCTEVAA